MSLVKTQAVINSLRARGITVHEWSGWQGRGNGYTSNYVGGIVHHTGSAYGSAYNTLVVGRADLSGPLCNFAGNDDGSITVISAGPANHAGASGGRSMGPLPVTQLFNPRVMGLEIVYPGTSPMRPAQYHAATVWARVVADVCGGGNIQCIRAHAETSVTGKWDPGDRDGHTIDMNAFRAASINPVEDEMTEQEFLGYMNKFWDLTRFPGRLGNRTLRELTEEVGARTLYIDDRTRAMAADLSDDEANIIAAVRAQQANPVDPTAFAAAVAPILAPLIHAGVTKDEAKAAALEAIELAFARGAGQ